MKAKRILLIALAATFVITTGTFAYTYTTTTVTIPVIEPTGNIATCNATTIQPDWNSVLTPVADTEILRPSTAGDETLITSQSPPSGGHWDKVGEEAADDDITTVYTSSSSWREDLYNITNHSSGAGTISDVTVYMVCRAATANVTQTSAYVHIKTNGNEYNGSEETLTDSYTAYSYQWDINPQTGNEWTWDEIDELQIGVGLRQPNAGEQTLCTQVYAEVSFEAPLLQGSVPTGDLFTIIPNPGYTGDLMVNVYLSNTGNLTKAYQYLNMRLYLEGSAEAGETPNYQLLTLNNGQATFTLENLSGISGAFRQTSQADFENDELTQLDATTSPGDVILDTLADNVTDTFDNESKIGYKSNLVVSGSQVKLIAGGASGSETFRPNAAGDDANIASQYPGSGAHWDKVDDVTADDYSTYIYNNSTSYQRDLYGIPDHSTGFGAINNVTAYFRFANSATTKWGIVYRGPSDDGFLKTTEISTTAQISDSVIDTLEWDTTNGMQPDIINISGSIYAIAYNGAGTDGWLATVEVDADGNITNTVIDTLEFDGTDCDQPEIIHVSGDIYAIAYNGPGADGWLCTMSIDSSGNIGNAIIDSFEFDPVDCDRPEIIHISGDIYAIAYNGPGGDGWLCTVDIDSAGDITNSLIDSLEFDPADGQEVDIIHISGDIYAIAYMGTGSDGWLCTMSIDSSGNIGNAIIDSFEFDPTRGGEADIIHIAGDVYAIAYRGPGSDGWLATVEIDSSGNITNSVTDSYEWNTSDGWEPNMAHVAGNFYAIAYRQGASNLGYLITVEIDNDGQITHSIIDSLQFEATYGFRPKLILVSGIPGNVYARAAIKTHGTVYTGSEESNATDTFVTKSYQWATNPNTGLAWTWAEINAMQIGVELRADSVADGAVCTQVYAVVNYTAYDSPGTFTSINLLSGETVSSIDSFGYTASAIPSGTGLKVQFSHDNTDWYNSSGALNGWDTLSQDTYSIDLSALGWSGPNFYYRTEFTSDGTDTPVLDEISIIFSVYYTSGGLSSSAYDTGEDLAWDWVTISFTIDEPAGTDIEFQIRMVVTEGGLSSATWYGPTGTDDYYTTSGTTINPVHDGDRWIQYKAYFSGPGGSTPTLSYVTITYTTEAVPYTVEVIGGGYALNSREPTDWAEGWTVTPELYCAVTQR